MNIITRKNLIIGLAALCVIGLALVFFMPEGAAENQREAPAAAGAH